MTREQKSAKKRDISHTISTAKSRLLDCIRALEDMGCGTDAERLGAIVGRLEDFQNRRLA